MPRDPWTIERTVDAGGTAIHYREAGAGPAVLLLHGFPQTGHCWRLVAPKLATEHRVLVPDLPGYGGSARAPGSDVATLARTMVAFLDAVGEDEAVVVGHDWGAAIAFRMAGAHRDRAPRLVVVNSPYRRLDLRRGWHMLAFNLPILPEVAFTLAGDRLVDLILRAGSADPSVFDDEARREYHVALRGLERQRAAFSYYRTITRRALTRMLPFRTPPRGAGSSRIEVPTLVVWGMRDPILPPSTLETIARDLPHATLERVEEAGHFVPEEAPERLADAILRFAGGQLSLL